MYAKNKGKLVGAKGCCLFKYIAAVKNNVLYELNFMRFYVENSQVNCVVKAIQFDRVIDKDCAKFCYKRANRGEIRYPNASDKDRPKELEKLIEKYKGESFFYDPKDDPKVNPNVTFDSKPTEILKAFIEFINTCEEEEKKNANK